VRLSVPALALVVVAVGCGKDELEAAQATVNRGADKVTEAAKQGVERVDQGIDLVKKEVAEAVADDKLPDAKLVDATKKSIKCKKERCTLPRNLADQLIDRTELMSGQARTYRLKRGETTVGVQLQQLGPIPKALGFRSGDVLVTVNGVALDSMQGLAQLFVEMKTADQLEIAYRRGSKMRKKTIAFV
jgi:type II secretory pathway component PulC